MIKQVIVGNEHFIELGNITIERNLITKIDFNFRNPNIAEVYAKVQPEFIRINKEVNFEFELKGISKFDFPSKKAKKNYYIISDILTSHLPNKFSEYNLSINLDFYELITIKWYKKQTLFHEINPKKKFLEYLMIGLPLLFIGFVLRGCHEDTMKTKDNKTEKQIEGKTLGNNGYAPGGKFVFG